LASNSLLEGLVFGARAGEAAATDSSKFKAQSSKLDDLEPQTWNVQRGIAVSTAVKKRVKRVMWERVGILRDEEGLTRAIAEFERIASSNLSISSRNFVTLALLVAKGALWREESRGGHFRTDFPEQHEEFRVHSIQSARNEIMPAEEINFGSTIGKPA
jgi:L-aspartate oxidase